MAGVPYTGSGPPSAAFMDKTVDVCSRDRTFRSWTASLHRPADGVMMSGAALAEVVGNAASCLRETLPSR